MQSNIPSLEALQDIRKIMDRSSRFISLSGLSGVIAGVFALLASYLAYHQIANYYARFPYGEAGYTEFRYFVMRLLLIAVVLLVVALSSALYFTWRKVCRDKVLLWDKTSKRLLLNLSIPIAAGAIFILGMLYHGVWQFVASACLIFYGLALVNASKYTYRDIRYLGILELVTGAVSIFFIHYGLYFWAFGFGVLHIIYGVIMWWKYEKQVST